jgi:flagellin
MALTVNTNIDSLAAQRNLSASGAQYSKALQRLSSGLRINSAADDAAGLAISTRLNSQVRGLNQAIRNANDGAALLGTAEGALGEVTNIVTRIKELAVQSANATNSATDRTSLNNEVQALISEVTRIASQTRFGNTNLLDGSFSGNFQVGVNTGESVAASISNFRAAALSGDVAAQTIVLANDANANGVTSTTGFTGLSATGLLIAGVRGTSYTRAAVAGDDTVSAVGAATSAIATAKVINEATPNTGVTATVTQAQQTFTGTFGTAFTLDTTTANKILQINGQYVTGAIGTSSTGRDALVGFINSQVSGVVAAAVGVTSFTLTATDGRNISVLAGGATTTGTAGFDLFTTTAATILTSETVVARGGLSLQSSGDFVTTSGAGTGQIGGAGAATAGATALSALDISSITGANTALFVADGILDTLSTARGTLGALQNRLSSTVANLNVVSEKVSDAKSRITDADFAAETANLTKAQILQQAGLSILAQANSAPQQVLKLLQ